jgi:hypothetical protein
MKRGRPPKPPEPYDPLREIALQIEDVRSGLRILQHAQTELAIRIETLRSLVQEIRVVPTEKQQ